MTNLISVIISIYSIKNCISRCLDSIVNQTYKNLEIIIIDNMPNSSFKNIYDSFAQKDKRIKIVNTTERDTNNLGLKLATGDYVHFISSCDYICKDYYEKMLSSIISSQSDMAISSFKNNKFEIVYDNHTTLEEIEDKVHNTHINKYEYITPYLISKKFLEKYEIDLSPTSTSKDLLFLMKTIFHANKIITVPNITCYSDEED